MLVRYRFYESHNRSIDLSFVAESEQLINSHQTVDRRPGNGSESPERDLVPEVDCVRSCPAIVLLERHRVRMTELAQIAVIIVT
jgi:hypothetical protein